MGNEILAIRCPHEGLLRERSVSLVLVSHAQTRTVTPPLAGKTVLDGEIVCLDKRGRPQFRDLLFLRGGETAKAGTASKMRDKSRGHDEDLPAIPDIDVGRDSRRGRQCQR